MPTPYEFEDASPAYFEHMKLSHPLRTEVEWFQYCLVNKIWIRLLGRKTAPNNPCPAEGLLEAEDRRDQLVGLNKDEAGEDNNNSDDVEEMEFVNRFGAASTSQNVQADSDNDSEDIEMELPIPLRQPQPGSCPEHPSSDPPSPDSCSEMELIVPHIPSSHQRPVVPNPSQLPPDFYASASTWNSASSRPKIARNSTWRQEYGALLSQGPLTASFQPTFGLSSRQLPASTNSADSVYPMPGNYWVPRGQTSSPSVSAYTGDSVRRLNLTNGDLEVAGPGHPLSNFPLIFMDVRRQRFDVEGFADEASYTSASHLLLEDSVLQRALHDISVYLLDEMTTLAGTIHLDEEHALSERRVEGSG